MSVYVVVQNQLCIEDYVEKLISAYPASAVRVSNYVPSVPNSSPVLVDKWLVVVYLSNSYKKQIEATLKYQSSSNIVFVTSLRNKEIQILLSEYGVEFSVKDVSVVSMNAMLEYVKKELKVGTSLARLVVNKSNLYEPTLVKNVETLKILDVKEISTNSINLYIPGKSVVSFGYLYTFLIYGTGDYSKVVALIYQYRNSVITLVKYLIKRLVEDLELYDMILDSELTLESVVEVSEVKKMHVDSLKRTLQLFNLVSYERLISLKLRLEMFVKPSPLEFIYFVKGVVS